MGDGETNCGMLFSGHLEKRLFPTSNEGARDGDWQALTRRMFGAFPNGPYNKNAECSSVPAFYKGSRLGICYAMNVDPSLWLL